MKQLLNGFDEKYYLTEDGKIYDISNDTYILPNKDHNFRLWMKDKTRKRISLKKAYMLVYGLNWCIDDIEDLDNEEWKEIENTNGYYFISNYGRCKSKKNYKSIILKEYITNKNYPKVTIVQNGERKCKLISNLVGESFLLNDGMLKVGYELHHIDKNPLNNNVNNLVYLSKYEHRKLHKELREQEKQKDEQ